MNSSGLRPRLAALITAVIASVYLLSLSSTTAWAKVGTITEFPVPTSSSQPAGITAGPDGNLWFTESNANKIGRITTSGGFSEFPVPTSSSDPIGITAGPDGNLWFAETAGNKIGRITTSGGFSEFSLPTTCGSSSGCEPDGITAGPDGNLWFTELAGNKIGRITTSGDSASSLSPRPVVQTACL